MLQHTKKFIIVVNNAWISIHDKKYFHKTGFPTHNVNPSHPLFQDVSRASQINQMHHMYGHYSEYHLLGIYLRKISYHKTSGHALRPPL